MFTYMLERRKREIKLLSIIVICSIAVFGIIAKINNAAAIVDIGITFSIGVVIVAEVIMGITFLPHEFNYAVGMGRTRKEFYKCNVIVTLLYLSISYMIMIVAALGFVVINIKGEAFGVITNPVYSIVVIVATIFSQFFYFWLFMEHQSVVYIVWIITCVLISNLVKNSLEIADALVKGTALNDYGEMLVFTVAGILCILGFIFVSKKILKMQVTG
ncbi:MAG: hypothetical protein IJC76_05590 [Lachnospiraceae bacterium]|nr:hypothetical protein [Lachnospiraceae bacterium]